MADTTDTSALTGTAPAETVPARPPWLQQQAVAAPRGRTQRSSQPPAPKNAAPLVLPQNEDAEPLPWQKRCVAWLRSAAATGYGLSLLLHVVLIVAMGLLVLPGLVEHDDITTVVQSDSEVPEEFDRLDDVQLDSPAGNEEIVKPQLTEMIEQDADLTMLEHKFLTDVTAAESEGEGGSTSGTGGGFRLLEPRNAVRRGSFTAWTIPIAQRVGEKPEAGDSPRPGQAYYIVIQVQLQEGRRTYKVSDLSGKIVGTDGYQQLIPAQAYVQEKDGRISRASIGRLLPIIDGVSQILIKVPGAEALVKDTISVKSRSLKEQQTLDLVFGERRDR